MIPQRENDPTESHSPPLALRPYEDVADEPSSAKRGGSTTVQTHHTAKSKQQRCEETRSRSMLLHHCSAQWQRLPTGSSSCSSTAANLTLRIRWVVPFNTLHSPLEKNLFIPLFYNNVLEGLTSSRQKHKAVFIIRDVNETHR